MVSIARFRSDDLGYDGSQRGRAGTVPWSHAMVTTPRLDLLVPVQREIALSLVTAITRAVQ